MADRFHVGQRVWLDWVAAKTVPHGTHGTVIRYDYHKKFGRCVLVSFDGHPPRRNPEGWFCPECHLNPLRDDRAAFERFMVRVVEPRKVVSVIRSDKATAK